MSTNNGGVNTTALHFSAVLYLMTPLLKLLPSEVGLIERTLSLPPPPRSWRSGGLACHCSGFSLPPKNSSTLPRPAAGNCFTANTASLFSDDDPFGFSGCVSAGRSDYD